MVFRAPIYESMNFAPYEHQDYPKMFYHPAGQKMGPEPGAPLVYREVRDETEEAEARAEGWHDHPAKALGAAPKDPVPVSEAQKALEAEQKRSADLQAQLDALKAAKPTGKPV
jgi:hypothetical protein